MHSTVEPAARRRTERAPTESHTEDQQANSGSRVKTSAKTSAKTSSKSQPESLETPIKTQPARKATPPRRTPKTAEPPLAPVARVAEIETPQPIAKPQRDLDREVPQNARSAQRSSRTVRPVRAAQPLEQTDFDLEIPSQEKPVQQGRFQRNAEKPRTETSRTGFVARSAQPQTASSQHQSGNQSPGSPREDDMSIAVAKPKIGGYTPRSAQQSAPAPSKPSHSAKMSKSAQPGSPTSSRFYRHDDDVDWIEED